VIYALTYLSRSALAAGTTAYHLNEILEVSRRRNAAAGITGALAAGDGHFVQTLEGEREAVERLFERLRQDPRHLDVQLVAGRLEASRRFGNWSMAYVGDDEDVGATFARHLRDLEPQLLDAGGRNLLPLMESLARAA